MSYQRTTSNSSKSGGSTIKVGGVLSGSLGWGLFFFVIGLFVYADLWQGFMLGIFAFVMYYVSWLYVIPIVGPILFIINLFVWDMGGFLASVLELPSSLAGAVAYWLPAIACFIFGIIFSAIIILGIVASIKS